MCMCRVVLRVRTFIHHSSMCLDKKLLWILLESEEQREGDKRTCSERQMDYEVIIHSSESIHGQQNHT